MPKLTEQILVDVLRHELALSANNIWIYDQDKKIPNDSGLYVTVGFQDSSIISNTNSVTATEDGMLEKQTVTVREAVQIDIFSSSNQVLQRRWEILQALASVYSMQQQERYCMRIFEIPVSFSNTSSAEGGSTIKRYTTIITCHALHSKEKVLSSPNGDYYDDFDTRVDDENTIGTANGIIEFNIIDDHITPPTPGEDIYDGGDADGYSDIIEGGGA